LDVVFQGQQVITTIQNVIGVIEGAEEPDRCARQELLFLFIYLF